MTKSTVRKEIIKDRGTTRGTRWKFNHKNISYVVYGTKTQAVERLCEMLDIEDKPSKPSKKKKKKSKIKDFS